MDGLLNIMRWRTMHQVSGRFGYRLRRGFCRLRLWRVAHIPDKPFMFILATVVGLMAGTGAYLLKGLVRVMSTFLTRSFDGREMNYWLLALPVVGILIVSAYMRFVLKRDISHGVSKLMAGMRKGIYSLGSYVMYSPILAGAVTLSFGGSAGSEGPIAYAGAGMGSNVGKLFKVDTRMLMILVGCGAGAGIAGIFKAPVGGALFALEILRVDFTVVSVLALVVSTLVSALTAYVLSGCTMDVSFLQSQPFDASVLPFLLLLGVFCGLYSMYYNYVMKLMEALLRRMTNPWVRCLFAGGALAVLLFLFPVLYGEGYNTIGHVINGDFAKLADGGIFMFVDSEAYVLLLTGLGIIICKSCATAMTVSGGGVAGDFAPTLFAGCIAGFVFAYFMNVAFGTHLPVSDFAYYGMAGAMAGVIRAPLMAIFLTAEMAGAYSSILPLTIVCALSFGVVRLITFDGYYSRHIDRKNGLLNRAAK